MTKITVICQVNRGNIEYLYPDRPVTGGDYLGRIVCGHTCGLGIELYDDTFQGVVYGRHTYGGIIGRCFLPDDGARVRAEKIAERIGIVRAWITECDATDAALAGTVTLLVA